MVVLLTLVPARAPAQEEPEAPGDPRVAWLRENVFPVRSIDPNDEDFRDLEPLRAALDGVRLVLLGEADHGSGSDFLAKTRLVKFLHRELGFDVLVFESPIYDMSVAWERLRGGAPSREAFALGATTWAAASQMQPLFAYLGEHARGRAPLEIAGFDHQHQLASGFYFADDMAGFLSERGLGGPLVDRESAEFAVLRGLVQALYQYGLVPRPDASTGRAFLDALDEALLAVSAMPDQRARQWAQVLRSMGCHARFVLRSPEIGACNRDEQMAKNLLWLANERYPERKIIVWSATAHAARVPRMSDFGVPERYGGGGPSMGRLVGEALGSKSYVIGVTSYRGSSRRPIVADQDPSPELEELMEGAGFDYGLLDLRRAAAGGSWAGGEFPARPMGHVTYPAVWSDLLDALLFVREQEPRRDEPSGTREEIEAIDRVRERVTAAFVDGDGDGYVALFTDDCFIMPPNGPRIRGRAALRPWIEGVHERLALSAGSTESLWIWVVGDRAWELYTSEMAVAPGADGETSEERYRGIRVYRREPDGTWLIAQDIWTAATAAGGS